MLRLKGGDPFVFGRGGEEALTLVEHGIPFRIVPGITAGIGGLAYAGIPVTHREINHAVTFLTGHDSSGLVPDRIDWQGIAKGSPVIVMYMAMKHIGADRRQSHRGRALAGRAGRLRLQCGDAGADGARNDAGARRSRCYRCPVWSRRRSSSSARWCACARRSTGSARLTGGSLVADPLGEPRAQGSGMSGLLIAAPSSGSGKTTVTLGLLRALRTARHGVAPGKAGPDYIDPAFHAAASGEPCLNYDPWAMRPELLRANAALRRRRAHARHRGDDGPLSTGGRRHRFAGRSCRAARSAGGPGRRLRPACRIRWRRWCAVMRDHRDDIRVAGVILNKVGSERHEMMLREALTRVGMPVLGVLRAGRCPELPERHLGLVQAGEHRRARSFHRHAADAVSTALRSRCDPGAAGEHVSPAIG